MILLVIWRQGQYRMVLFAQCPKKVTPNNGEKGVGSLHGQKQALSILKQRGTAVGKRVLGAHRSGMESTHLGSCGPVMTLFPIRERMRQYSSPGLSLRITKILWDDPITQ